MSYVQNPYGSPLGDFAALAAADERSTFISKTYLHLAGAIALFAALEAVILKSGIGESLMGFAMTRWGWLIIIGAFMLVSIVASNWAVSAVSPATQYAGLGLYVLAESIIFAPLLFFAQRYDALKPNFHHRVSRRHNLGSLRRLDSSGVYHAERLLLLEDNPGVRRLCGDGFNPGFPRVPIPPWDHFYLRHNRPGLRLHSLRHLQRPAPLSSRAARRRRPGPVRLGSPAVLLFGDAVHVAAGLR